MLAKQAYHTALAVYHIAKGDIPLKRIKKLVNEFFKGIIHTNSETLNLSVSLFIFPSKAYILIDFIILMLYHYQRK